MKPLYTEDNKEGYLSTRYVIRLVISIYESDISFGGCTSTKKSVPVMNHLLAKRVCKGRIVALVRTVNCHVLYIITVDFLLNFPT